MINDPDKASLNILVESEAITHVYHLIVSAPYDERWGMDIFNVIRIWNCLLFENIDQGLSVTLAQEKIIITVCDGF